MTATVQAEDFATVEPANTTEGYLVRLLINESPFPGEHGYESVADMEAAMLSIFLGLAWTHEIYSRRINTDADCLDPVAEKPSFFLWGKWPCVALACRQLTPLSTLHAH